MGQQPLTPIHYLKYSSHNLEESAGGVITEANIGLTVNGEPWLSFMCTPSQPEALAIGFLFNEGVINTMDEVEILQLCEHGDNVDVWLNHPVEKPAKWRRTSGCTGGVTTDKAQESTLPLDSDDKMSIDLVLSWMDRLLENQELYREVRGVHCSILTNGVEILAQAEDIGRHNTLDKIAGIVMMEDIQAERRMILTTGRISSEMLQKSARLGAAILVSRTSPSSMSIELAHQFGITLIGYARRNQCHVYTHPERLITSEGWSFQPVKADVQSSLV